VDTAAHMPSADGRIPKLLIMLAMLALAQPSQILNSQLLMLFTGLITQNPRSMVTLSVGTEQETDLQQPLLHSSEPHWNHGILNKDLLEIATTWPHALLQQSSKADLRMPSLLKLTTLQELSL